MRPKWRPIVGDLRHELGHIHQTRPGLKWHGMTEVTNNITAIYVQTKVYNEPSRLTVQDRYVSAFNSIMAGQKAHNAESDVFNKLVPFWQLELYFGEVKGNTPMKRTDHGGSMQTSMRKYVPQLIRQPMVCANSNLFITVAYRLVWT